MKKLVLVLVIALIAVPSFGAVTMTLTQVGTTNVYNVNYATSDANLPRAFALTVSVAGGGKISAVTPTMTGECTETVRGYGIFPGTIVIVDGVPTSYGTPVSPATYPGAAGTGLGTSTVVLEMGSLYVDNNSPATSGTLCTVTIDCNGATVDQTLSAALESTYRGGVVMENGDQPAVTIANATYTGCAVAPSCASKFTGAALTLYNNYIANGKDPSCWCNRYQCWGDADNAAYGSGWLVYNNDLNMLVAAWKAKVTDAAANPCADFDHAVYGSGWTVYNNDLNILVTNWKKKAANLTDCPSYIAP